jgi:hypothetical protein
VYLGRFSADFTTIEAWARVTHNSGGDSYPDVWIDRDRSPHPVRASGTISPGPSGRQATPPGAGAAAAKDSGRVVLEARLVRPGSIPSPQAIAPYRHALVASVYELVKVIEGTYSARQVRAAQWAIRDGRVLADARRTVGTVYRLTLERYDDHPELEGERLIAGGDAPPLPLYYEVGAR